VGAGLSGDAPKRALLLSLLGEGGPGVLFPRPQALGLTMEPVIRRQPLGGHTIADRAAWLGDVGAVAITAAGGEGLDVGEGGGEGVVGGGDGEGPQPGGVDDDAAAGDDVHAAATAKARSPGVSMTTPPLGTTCTLRRLVVWAPRKPSFERAPSANTGAPIRAFIKALLPAPLTPSMTATRATGSPPASEDTKSARMAVTPSSRAVDVATTRHPGANVWASHSSAARASSSMRSALVTTTTGSAPLS
jgi:hypothetical protein